jgi:hypothetical protein
MPDTLTQDRSIQWTILVITLKTNFHSSYSALISPLPHCTWISNPYANANSISAHNLGLGVGVGLGSHIEVPDAYSATHLPVPQLMDNPDQSFRPSHQILGVSRSHHIQSRWKLVAKGSLLATRMLFSCWRCVVSALLAGLQLIVIASARGSSISGW